MPRGLLASALLTLLLLGCSSGRPDLYADAKPLATHRVVPFDLTYGVPVVQVEIDGQGPFHLVFDTGAAMLALDTSVAERLALPRSRSADPSFVRSIGGYADVYYRRVETLRTGSLEIGGLDAMIIDLPEVAGPVIDGLLGLAAFYPWVTTVDYQRRTITFADGPRLDGDAPGVLPLVQEYGLSVSVDAEYAAERFVVKLDTGAGMALFARDRFLQRAGPSNLAWLGPLYSPTGVAGSGAGRVEGDLVLGAHTFRRPIVTAARSQAIFISSGRDWGALLETPLIMGTPFLRQFEIVLDQKAGRVALRRVEGSGPIESPALRTVWLDVPVRREADHVLVVEASPRSPAPVPPEQVRSGLLPGDRILAVDGVALNDFDLGSLSQPDKDRVKLSGQRGAQAFELVAPVITIVP